VDHLYKQAEAIEVKKQNRAKAIKEQQLAKEANGATYAPATNNYHTAGTVTSGDKCLDLYARVKPGAYKEKKDMPAEEREFRN